MILAWSRSSQVYVASLLEAKKKMLQVEACPRFEEMKKMSEYNCQLLLRHFITKKQSSFYARVLYFTGLLKVVGNSNSISCLPFL